MRKPLVTAFTILLIGGTAACGAPAADANHFPERPYTLDIAAVDPCSAFTAGQRAGLDLREGRPGTSHSGTSRGCTWSSDDGLGYNLQTFDKNAVVAIGAEPTSTVVTVAGFGAVQSSPPAQGTGLPFCQVVLDLAEHASLRAQLQVNPPAAGADRRTVKSTCVQLHDVTAQMLENLRAQQGQ